MTEKQETELKFELAAIAPPLELFQARRLGKKIVTSDSGHTVTAYLWEGAIYVTDFSVAKPTSIG